MREPLNFNVLSHEVRAAKGGNGHSTPLHELEQFGEQQWGQPDSPFPYLEVALKKAKESPFMVVGIMISIAAIIVGAVMSLTVGFGIFLFTMNGTMHEMKAQQSTILEQLAASQKKQTEDGNAMRAYEAANGKRIEFFVGLMSKEQQERANDYDRAHPVSLMPEKPKESN